jgi:hypothetical protein
LYTRDYTTLTLFGKNCRFWNILPNMEKGGKFFQDLEGLEKTPKSVGITGLWRRCDYWVVALLEKYGDAGKFWKGWEILGGVGDFGRGGRFWEGRRGRRGLDRR